MRHPSLGSASPRFKPIDDDVREYRLELESLARHLLRAPETGEGSGQGVLLETVIAIPSFHGVDTVRIWLHRTASSETRRLRARRRHGAVDAYLDSVVAGRLDRRRPDFHDLIRDLKTRLEVLEALARLPDNYRCAVLLKEGEGLSVEEVARLMGTTSGSARSVLYRARHAMREHRGI